jgi:ATPase subunit of ABC transporter with duplicated ATPase domains
LDVDYGTITLYTGNYSAFVRQKEIIREQKEAEIENVSRDIAHKQAFIDRFKAKASKARQAQSRIKQIEKIEIPELKRSSRRYPSLNFEIARPSGKDVLSVKNLSKSYSEKSVLKDVSFDVQRQERVAIIGPNGVGKSTLLKVIALEQNVSSGHFKWGYEASVGYFAQDHDVILRKSHADAEAWIWQFCPEQSQTFVRSLLGRLLFVGDEAKKKVSNLSGG